MFAGHSPRMIFSHKRHLVEPNFPKYMPFKQVDAFLVLEFDIPTQVSLSPLPTSTTTQPTAQVVPSFSLQASSSYLPFAGLAFNLVFEGPISGLQKDCNWTGPRPQSSLFFGPVFDI